MVQTVLEAIHLFYHPRTIYIVTPHSFCDMIEKKSEEWNVRVKAIPEETFFILNLTNKSLILLLF
jgi:ferredoxin-NADP reductase